MIAIVIIFYCWTWMYYVISWRIPWALDRFLCRRKLMSQYVSRINQLRNPLLHLLVQQEGELHMADWQSPLPDRSVQQFGVTRQKHFSIMKSEMISERIRRTQSLRDRKQTCRVDITCHSEKSCSHFHPGSWTQMFWLWEKWNFILKTDSKHMWHPIN